MNKHLLGGVILAYAALAAIFPAAAFPAQAKVLCVGNTPQCFSTIQAAVNAASDGDTIKIDRGTFVGGVMIDVSIKLVGAGAAKTTIRGGGRVITIGQPFEPDPPTVSIKGVTITGGSVDSNPPDAFAAVGGGISIEIGENYGRGATVTIADSAITGNRVSPKESFPGGDFALAQGGGIDSFGDLTLVNTAVTNNVAGPAAAGLPTLTSVAVAGGIYNHIQAALTIDHSVISANHVRATPPNGHVAVAGGIGSLGELAIKSSIVNDNTAELESVLPSEDFEQSAFAGGIFVDFCPVEFCGPPNQSTITRTIVHGNTVTARNTNGESYADAYAGGIEAAGPLAIDHSSIDHNVVSAKAAGDAYANAGGISVEGPPVTIADSVIVANRVVADGGRGAVAQGAGIANFGGMLTLERTLVADNSASAKGKAPVTQFGDPSEAQGGGIWNDTFPGHPTPQLTLVDSAILRNTLTATTAFPIQGGGLFTKFPVTRTRTLIAANRPDQCFGC